MTVAKFAEESEGERPIVGKGLSPSPRMAASAVLMIALLAAVLRVVQLGSQPLWFDEGYSYFFATRDLASLARLTAEDIHPPAYYILLNGWLRLFGQSDVAGRLLSAALGVCAVFLIYAVAKLLSDRLTAVLAASLMAISPLHVYYSQEVRMYAMVTTLGLASTLFFCKLVRLGAANTAFPVSPPRYYLWIGIGYVASTALAMYTQYYAAFLPLTHGIFLLTRATSLSRIVWRRWLLAAITIGVLYLPWLTFAGMKLQSYVQGKVAVESYQALAPFEFLLGVLVAFASGAQGNTFGSWLALPLLSLATAGALLALRRPTAARDEQTDIKKGLEREPGSALFWVLALFVPLAAGWLINLRFPFHPPMWERLFLFSLPAFLILAARGTSFLLSFSSWALLPVALLFAVSSGPGLADFYTVPRYAKEDYRPVAAQASALGQPDDLVLAVYPWQIGYYEAYYQGERPQLALVPAKQWADDTEALAQGLASLTAGHPRIWLLSYEVLGRRLETQLESNLTDRCYPTYSAWFGNSRLLLFSQNEGRPVASAPSVSFEDKLQLVDPSITTGEFEASRDIVNISLGWRLLRPLGGKSVVNLRLADAKDRTWAQRDAEPNAGLLTLSQSSVGDVLADRHGLLIPSGTPPGTYQIKAGITYENARLSALDPAGAPKGPEVTLGEVTVRRSSLPPRVASVFVQNQIYARLSRDLTLVGFSGPDRDFSPGDRVPFTLFWRAERDIAEAVPIKVNIRNHDLEIIATESSDPVDGKYPTNRWVNQELVRDQRDVRVPPETPSGDYTLHVSAGEGETTVQTVTLHVKGREHVFEPPPIAHPLHLQFGGVAELSGYQLENAPSGSSGEAGQTDDPFRIQPGQSFTLTLFWQPTTETESDLKVFTHLLDGTGRMWGQLDSKPGGGRLPTTGWVPAEYLVDQYPLSAKLETPPGDLHLEIGMYDALTGKRLEIQDAHGQPLGDSVVLTRILFDRR